MERNEYHKLCLTMPSWRAGGERNTVVVLVVRDHRTHLLFAHVVPKKRTCA